MKGRKDEKGRKGKNNEGTTVERNVSYEERTDGRTDGKTDGRTDGRMKRRTEMKKDKEVKEKMK